MHRLKYVCRTSLKDGTIATARIQQRVLQNFRRIRHLLQNKAFRSKVHGEKSFISAKHPDYSQRIIGKIQSDTLAPDEIKCSFVKEVILGNKTTRYAAYLHFKKRGAEWKITTEGDETTDMNLLKKNPQKCLPMGKIEGDFNGDGEPEYMWLERPQFPPGDEEENFGECQGDCKCMIRFSNPDLPAIELGSCIGGLPVNKGDLDGNGTDEIGILPDWWTSCWRSYFVYTFSAKNWDYFVPPITTHCTQWEDEFDFIQKAPDQKRQRHYSIQHLGGRRHPGEEKNGEDLGLVIGNWLLVRSNN